MIYVGIDLGKTGAVAIISGDTLVCHPMPMIGKEYDLRGLLSLLRTMDPKESHVAYEVLQPMPPGKGGSKANFSRGYAMGMIETALEAARIPHSPVRPQAWQKAMFSGMKVGKGETKNAALQVARRLWPDRTWLIGKRTKPDEGLIDAALIAEWLRRELH